jgi:hypothetical protein
MKPCRGEYVEQLAVQILGKRIRERAAAALSKKAREQARADIGEGVGSGLSSTE